MQLAREAAAFVLAHCLQVARQLGELQRAAFDFGLQPVALALQLGALLFARRVTDVPLSASRKA